MTPLLSLKYVAQLALAMVLLVAMPAGAKLTVMHGFADYTSALLWVMADAPGPISISWQPEGQAAERQLTLDAIATSGNAIHARLTGLRPGKTVSYRVTGDGDTRAGTLTTQPFWSKACLLYTSPSPRDRTRSRMPSSA